MPSNKRQHYVPQYYLRGFTERKGLVSMYRLDAGQFIERAALAGQCYRNNFYGSDVERLLSTLEGMSAVAVRRVLSGSYDIQSDTCLRSVMTLTFLSMLFRTIKRTELLHEAIKLLRQELMNDLLEDVFRSHLETASPPTPAQVVLDSVHYLPLLDDLAFNVISIGESSSKVFLTSDHPVIRINPFMQADKIPRFKSGLMERGLLMLLPLNSRRLAVLYDAYSYKIGTKRHRTRLLCSEQDIDVINRLVISNAKDNIFGMRSEADALTLLGSVRRSQQSSEIERITISNGTSPKQHNNGLRISERDVFLRETLSFLSIKKSAKVGRKKYLLERPHLGWPRNGQALNATYEFRDPPSIHDTEILLDTLCK